ncbi:MAG TPA: hypothetical protein VKU19_29895 [Bryobacteraceae bacterium]|nr:hypothetical protein [Bryobacteraceae bacterium]
MKWLLFTFLICSLHSQTVIPEGTPGGYQFDGQVKEWKASPPTFPLRPSPTGGRTASVWVRQVPEGILVAGEVQGAAPDFARTAADMVHKDHVEIWLAPEKAPQFPPVGWSNNMMEDVGGTEKDCVEVVSQWASGREGECKAWLAGVAAHRRRLTRLFVRQYGLTPYAVTEAFATPAWEQIVKTTTSFKEIWTPLRPSRMPTFRAATNDTGYSFEALLPWESLPPMPTLQLKSLRLMVDVFSSHPGDPKDQPFSTSSPTRKYGDPATFNVVSLAASRDYRITDCQYPLEGHSDSGSRQPAVFQPARELNISQSLVLMNPNSFRNWGPSGESPTVVAANHFQKPVAPNVAVCGPTLAWSTPSGIRRFKEDVDMATLDTRAQPDGSYLVKTGPNLASESLFLRIDPCLYCVNVEMHIYQVGPQGEPKPVFDFQEALGEPSASRTVDLDLHLSPDWSKVTVYREVAGDGDTHWTSEIFCREATEYKSCGENPASPAPSPRVIEPAKQ